jgi:hypothetical protein
VGVGAVAANAASIGVPCPILATTGVPCPACGMTRLADAVAHGRLVEAITTDPAGVVFLLVVAGMAAVFVLSRLRRLPRRLPDVRAVPAVLGALLGAHWVTTLVTGGYVHP